MRRVNENTASKGKSPPARVADGDEEPVVAPRCGSERPKDADYVVAARILQDLAPGLPDLLAVVVRRAVLVQRGDEARHHLREGGVEDVPGLAEDDVDEGHLAHPHVPRQLLQPGELVVVRGIEPHEDVQRRQHVHLAHAHGPALRLLGLQREGDPLGVHGADDGRVHHRLRAAHARLAGGAGLAAVLGAVDEVTERG